MIEVDVEYIVEFLVRLLDTPSPSGSTERAIDLVAGELGKLGTPYEKTRKGGLLATIAGKDCSRHRALSGHVDTLGAMVKEIKSNGRLRFSQVGGYTMHSVEGEYCTIESSGGTLYTGTILPAKSSVHVHRDLDKFERSLENMEIRLDERVSSANEVESLGIAVGDFIHFDPRVQVTPSGFVKSRHLDDKAGVAIMLGVAKHFCGGELPAVTTHLYISNYEEVGHGASYGIPEQTEELVAVDMGAIGEGQSTDEFSVSICAKDSSGPYDLKLRKHLTSLAAGSGIGYKVDIYPYYGSDASAALRAGANLRACVVGPGVDASHSYERTHKDALANTCRLMVAYLRSR
jgi:putative aminopeptidase FrvX